jgi:hypothetical protein
MRAMMPSFCAGRVAARRRVAAREIVRTHVSEARREAPALGDDEAVAEDGAPGSVVARVGILRTPPMTTVKLSS